MPGGRPKKPVALQKGEMSNEHKRIRQEQENKLKCETDQLTAPSWLDDDAKEEFERVVEALVKLECVGNLDLTVLAMYCDAYSNYIKLSKAIQETGPVEIYVNTKGEANKVVSANVKAQQRYSQIIFSCSGKLGLSISDRLKLVVSTEDNSDDLLLNALKSRR